MWATRCRNRVFLATAATPVDAPARDTRPMLLIEWVTNHEDFFSPLPCLSSRAAVTDLLLFEPATPSTALGCPTPVSRPRHDGSFQNELPHGQNRPASSWSVWHSLRRGTHAVERRGLRWRSASVRRVGEAEDDCSLRRRARRG